MAEYLLYGIDTGPDELLAALTNDLGRARYLSAVAADLPVQAELLYSAWEPSEGDYLAQLIDPGQPEERNIYDAMNSGKQVKKIPMTLGEALDALDGDEVIKAALPGDMYRVFSHYKRDEWERYCATVTDWDVQEYLDILP